MKDRSKISRILKTEKCILTSRFTPQINGNRDIIDDYDIRCTSANKWVFAILMGMIFFLLSNSLVLYVLFNIINRLIGKESTSIRVYPGLVYNLLLTCIFILIIRCIMW